MLSRVAERMYWIGRYLERAENTARLVNVNASLVLDLPRIVKYIWSGMISICGSSDLFFTKYEKSDERNVIKFMLADESNPGSIVYSIRMARENARTTREIMPSEAWELINEFHLFVKQHVNSSLKRDAQNEFLDSITSFCHQITGLLFGNMSHGEAYSFIRIGSNLERADMTTRIVDVGCMNLLRRREDIPETLDNILWMNVLHSLSAYQMYKQHVRDKVNSKDVVAFLMKDQQFPRAVAHCLTELNNCVLPMPKNDQTLRSVTRVQRIIAEIDVARLLENNLHEFIDELQIDLADIHTQVSHTWFGYSPQETAERQV
ncbi:MAG: alpha-E domain-containing protein [Gammaproteobacteria bacterium]|nr:alpha-E domain-containing protein [Gammaproteobacteria bacterium]